MASSSSIRGSFQRAQAKTNNQSAKRRELQFQFRRVVGALTSTLALALEIASWPCQCQRSFLFLDSRFIKTKKKNFLVLVHFWMLYWDWATGRFLGKFIATGTELLALYTHPIIRHKVQPANYVLHCSLCIASSAALTKQAGYTILRIVHGEIYGP